MSDPFRRLPIPCLRDIASRLSNEDAARTVLISKAWSEIWPCSRTIVLDDSLFEPLAFINFARRLAEKYDEQWVDSFRLIFSRPHEYAEDVNNWVSIATARRVHEMELNFTHSEDQPEIPLMTDVYNAGESLFRLKLSRCSFEPMCLCMFSGLGVLSIAKINMHHCSINTILNSCEMLRDLSLISLSGLQEIIIDDQDPPLTRLTIIDCDICEGITLCASSLKFLKYSGHLVPIYLFLPGIDEVELDFYCNTLFFLNGEYLREILIQLEYAKKLTLCSYTAQVISSSNDPLFLLPERVECLKHLILNTALHIDELPGIAMMMRSYVWLETLTLKMRDYIPLEGFTYPFPQRVEGASFWDRHGQIGFLYLWHNLRTVKIKGFRGEENEKALLQYLSQNCIHLYSIHVKIFKDHPNWEDHLIRAVELRATMPRGMIISVCDPNV